MPCDWPIDRSYLPVDSGGEPTPLQDAAAALAVQILWALSGHQFGVCGYIVRPCPPPFGYHNNYGIPYYSLWWDGANYQTFWCGCPGRCRESGPAAVHLPGPAQDVIEVSIGNTVLSSDQYVLEGDVLHRINGVWPGQDLTRPIGYAGAWSVEYTRGTPVPAGVDVLTGMLAKELHTAMTGGKCRLPGNVTQVSRQGVSYQFDPQRIYDAGKTGLQEVDAWLQSVNPHRLMCAPTVI